MNFDTAETIRAITSANDWSANAAMLFCVLIVLAIFFVNNKNNKDREIAYKEERKDFLETLENYRLTIEKVIERIR
ncbi:MAG: hypothetical protein LBD41_03465 [Clostridiales Family XIII bacterium]|jgi:hypothetical protein|nr:hypothetical protein [Clostridiales Family XIII bacterium]